MVKNGQISVEMSVIASDIFIEATVHGVLEHVTVTIQHAHTNIIRIEKNGKILFQKEPEPLEMEESSTIHQYTLDALYQYAKTVDIEELRFIRKAYELNLDLFYEGIKSKKTTYAPYLLKQNDGKVISEDEQKTASLLCNAAIEARVLGLSKPAMSITDSGAHGIIAMMPLYAAYKVKEYSQETLLRATALSYLVCTYIKEYSGKLSAFCGCAMKGVVAVDAAYRSVDMAMNGVYIYDVHGINADTPEETMRNMGLIASPGMIGTEKTMMDILNGKNK